MQPDSAIELKHAFTTGLSGAGATQLDRFFCEFATIEPHNNTPSAETTTPRNQPVVSFILFSSAKFIFNILARFTFQERTLQEKRRYGKPRPS